MANIILFSQIISKLDQSKFNKLIREKENIIATKNKTGGSILEKAGN